MKIKLFFFIITLFVAGASATPSSEGSNDALFNNNWNIVWARCVSAELAEKNWYVVYTFDVIETLRGFQKQQFQIHGDIINWQTANDEISSFDGHSDESFWSDKYEGRCYFIDESTLGRSFNVGWEYLIFLDNPFRRGYEVVSQKSDKWYLYVKQKIEEQKENNEKIRRDVQWRLSTVYIHRLIKERSGEYYQSLTRTMLKYVWKNPSATNADIEQKVEELVRAQTEAGVTSQQSTMPMNPPPRGAEGSGGSEDSNP